MHGGSRGGCNVGAIVSLHSMIFVSFLILLRVVRDTAGSRNLAFIPNGRRANGWGSNTIRAGATVAGTIGMNGLRMSGMKSSNEPVDAMEVQKKIVLPCISMVATILYQMNNQTRG